ncbi:MAG: hypothetical protein HYY58_04445, partial [Candidatus Omnitrophica bacterium]|nr:hypothetical protein [Candidatus Omnitrophota bacterium]
DRLLGLGFSPDGGLVLDYETNADVLLNPDGSLRAYVRTIGTLPPPAVPVVETVTVEPARTDTDLARLLAGSGIDPEHLGFPQPGQWQPDGRSVFTAERYFFAQQGAQRVVAVSGQVTTYQLAGTTLVPIGVGPTSVVLYQPNPEQPPLLRRGDRLLGLGFSPDGSSASASVPTGASSWTTRPMRMSCSIRTGACGPMSGRSSIRSRPSRSRRPLPSSRRQWPAPLGRLPPQRQCLLLRRVSQRTRSSSHIRRTAASSRRSRLPPLNLT